MNIKKQIYNNVRDITYNVLNIILNSVDDDVYNNVVNDVFDYSEDTVWQNISNNIRDNVMYQYKVINEY